MKTGLAGGRAAEPDERMLAAGRRAGKGGAGADASGPEPNESAWGASGSGDRGPGRGSARTSAPARTDGGTKG